MVRQCLTNVLFNKQLNKETYSLGAYIKTFFADIINSTREREKIGYEIQLYKFSN